MFTYGNNSPKEMLKSKGYILLSFVTNPLVRHIWKLAEDKQSCSSSLLGKRSNPEDSLPINVAVFDAMAIIQRHKPTGNFVILLKTY